MMKRIIAMALLFVGVLMALMGCVSDSPGTDADNLKLEFSTLSVYNEQVTLDITPNYDNVSYYWSAMPKATYEAAGGDDAIRKEDMDYFNRLAVEGGLTVGAIIGQKTTKGVGGGTLRKLKMNTEYVVYGYALAPDGRKTSGFSKGTFTTTGGGWDPEAPLRPKTTITPRRPAGMTTVESSIQTENGSVRWLSQIVEDSELQAFTKTHGTPALAFKAIYNETLEYTAEKNGVSIERVVSEAGKVGDGTQSHRYLRPENKYWVYVASVNEVGEILDFDYKEITTGPRAWAGGAQNAFTAEVRIPPTYTDDMGTTADTAPSMEDPTSDDVDLPGLGQQSVYIEMKPYVNGVLDDGDGKFNTFEPIDPAVESVEKNSQWTSQWVITEEEFRRIAGTDSNTQAQNFLEAAVVEENKWIAGGYTWRQRFRRGMTEGLFGNAQQPLSPGTEYRYLVFAYNETYVSNLFQLKFTTLPVEDARLMRTSIYPNPGPDGVWNANGGRFPGGEDDEWGNLGSRLGWGACWSRTAYVPSDNLVPYYHHVELKSVFDSNGNTLAERIQNSFDAYVALWENSFGGEVTHQQVLESLRSFGGMMQNEYQMDEETDYVAWAATFDVEGNLLSQNPVHVEFRTPKFVPKDIQVDVDLLGNDNVGYYWDGQDVFGPQYTDYAIVVVDNMRITGIFDPIQGPGGTTSSGFGEWVVMFLKNSNGRDYTDTSKYSDAWICGAVWNAKNSDPNCHHHDILSGPRAYNLDYTNEWTMITICADRYAEEFGKVTRRKIARMPRGQGQLSSTFPAPLIPATRTATTADGVEFAMGVDLDQVKMTLPQALPYNVVFSAAQRINNMAKQGVAPRDFSVEAPKTSEGIEFNSVSAAERLKSQAVRFMHRVR